MRDWSSDVCSSDLNGGGDSGRDADRLAVADPGRHARTARANAADAARSGGRRGRRYRWRLCDNAETVDRKSVVSGKSVSVRVDLGGRSIIKQNNTSYISVHDILYSLHTYDY